MHGTSLWQTGLVDVAVIMFMITAIVGYRRYRQQLMHMGLALGALMVLAGLGVVSLFYLVDLLGLVAARLARSPGQAMQLSKTLHDNYVWLAVALGAGVISLGLLRLLNTQGGRLRRNAGRRLSGAPGHTDPLTGALTVADFHELLNQALVRARRKGWSIAVLSISVRCPHASSEHGACPGCLRKTAERLRTQVRRCDAVAHLGDGILCVMLTHLSDRARAASIAEKLVNSLTVPAASRHASPPSLTTSMGIAMYPDDGDTSETLLSHAEQARQASRERD